MKKIKGFLLLLTAALLLSGCSLPHRKEAAQEPPRELPRAEVVYTAPVGDAALSYTEEMPLDYPSYDGMSLITVTESVTFKLSSSREESVVRAMLAFRGNGGADSLGGDVRLFLLGASPVEVSRDTVTVNLGASALRLDRSRLYMVGQALANSLCRLEGIRYVNLLVAGKAVGLDVGNSLPMGAFAAAEDQDAAGAYGQLLSRRAGAEGSASSSPFAADVTLYYPLAGKDGVVCEGRSLSFESQLTGDVVNTVLRELALGLEEAGAPQLPLLADLLTEVPHLVAAPDGGTLLQLSFARNLEEMLEAYGVSMEAEMTSLCDTFVTFLPGLRGVAVEVGGNPVDSLLMVEEDETAAPSGEILLRGEGAVLMDYCTLYFPDGEGSLTPVSRPVEYSAAQSPRSLLWELSRGPLPGEGELQAVMPEDLLSDTTIIGLALEESVLLVNLSPAFDVDEDALTAPEEQRMAYAITRTLCGATPAKAVCFFRSGRQFDGFTGEIAWDGLFYPVGK